jgi:hypothetical protein
MRRGRWVAKSGRHLGQEAIRREYHAAIDAKNAREAPA